VHPRVGISTISFRFRPFDEALRIIAGIGASEIDLGAIPDVCDHVPVPFTGSPIDYAEALAAHGLSAGAVNADVGPLNDPNLSDAAIAELAQPLIELAAATGAVLILPCGAQDWATIVSEEADLALIERRLRDLSAQAAQRGVRLLVEVLHHRRWVHTVERANRVLADLGPEVIGLLFDVAHVVASDEDVVAWAEQVASRVERVHLRDAVPGNLNVGIGRGDVDFAGVIRALEAAGFAGTYILELETHDVEEDDREADAQRSFELITTELAAARAAITPEEATA
jgi:sugar phosphate isomerase/epimerase